MDSLHHSGIIVLQPPQPHGLKITARETAIVLDQLQEEMAVAWVKKLGTPYVEDAVFAANFMRDFSKALRIRPPLKVDEVDFSEVVSLVQAERAAKEAMTGEAKKSDLERRKAEREHLKELYGHAIVDGQRMELANYQTEPSGIFMGRGQHPLRGRWKHSITHRDISLNLSPDAPRPAGDWSEIVWAPECMWIAKWTDGLTGNLKYIWLHDSTPIKQEREEAKFEKAVRTGERIEEIRQHIMAGLTSDDSKRRMVAAACYLIDRLSLRVGDEKDPDEADTVGATTLRAEHLTFTPSSVVFDFLGKDSVPWHKELEMPPEVYSVFRELYHKATDRVESFASRRSERTKGDPKKTAQIFSDIGSSHVNRFLSEVDPDLTAKVFRTFHATTTMREELANSKTKRSDPEFIKMDAVRRANLEVARVMNHTKQAPKGWGRATERFEERIKAAGKKVVAARKPLEDRRRQLRELKKREEAQRLHLQEAIRKQKGLVERYWQSVLSWRKKRDRAKSLWDNARDEKQQTRASHRKGKTSKKERLETTQKRIETYRARWANAEVSLRRAHERYEKSKSALQKKQDALTTFKEKSSQQILRRETMVEAAKARVKKAEEARQKIEVEYAMAKETRTWNLGTSLKSYIHPRVVYGWCQRVDYDWHKVYSKTLQRKFNWVETSD